MITLENKRVHDFIVIKDELVNQGRKISRDIEDIEIKVARFEEKEKKITAKVVPPKELTDRGDEVAKQMEALGNELNEIADKINKSKLAAIPNDIKEPHLQLLKDKEKLERERNKIALKVQKIKDKIVPIVQREVSPLIRKERMEQIDMGKFDDIETAKTKDGKVVISTFNHLSDYIKKFRG